MKKVVFYSYLCVHFLSCNNSNEKAEMIKTSNQIVKELYNRDSSSLSNLFVMDISLSKKDISRRYENINKGYELCAKFLPVNISNYKIRIDSTTNTVYTAFIEIPFTDTLTKETKGKITVVFANYFGFNKAEDLKVTNFEEIDEKYRKNTNNGKFNAPTNIVIDTTLLLNGIRHTPELR